MKSILMQVELSPVVQGLIPLRQSHAMQSLQKYDSLVNAKCFVSFSGIVIMLSQTICLTYTPRNIDTSAERALVEAGSAGILDLEEALEPPNLEDALGDHDAHLEDAPPLDAGVGAFGGVAVGAFADDDVALLVLDLGEEFGEELDCWWRELLAVRVTSPLGVFGVLHLPSFSSGS
jgi:hypothetical protein